jgi:hypothetical protein
VTVKVLATGVDNFAEYLATFPQVAARALSISLNDTARDALAGPIKDAMLKETAFPPGYLDDTSRLGINIYARPDSLEAGIVGRQRATSLARYVTGGVGAGQTFKPGLIVTVNPGSPVPLQRAFLVPLNSGNTGLAIRLKGGAPRGTAAAISLGKGLFLLYAASVDQVFRSVADDLSDVIGDMLTAEFFRQLDVQLERLDSGG